MIIFPPITLFGDIVSFYLVDDKFKNLQESAYFAMLWSEFGWSAGDPRGPMSIVKYQSKVFAEKQKYFLSFDNTLAIKV